MVETELKFQVPLAARPGLLRAVATAGSATTRLRARYFDTPDRRLAAAGVALRLRREGRLWVQTLKGPGAGLSRRFEHEVPLPAARGIPALDPGLHAGTAAAGALRRALGAGAAPLELVFETDVQRCHRVLRVAGARIELALDIGSVRAAGRRLPIWELEFELRQGSVDALYLLATRWVQRHGLWLDTRTKAERGDLLARGLAVRDATGPQRPALQPSMPLPQALRVMARAALAQALPNAAALAGGVGQAEHLHQLRVGLRRLRSLMRLFVPAPQRTRLPSEAAAAALADLFRRLGGARDRDVLAATWLPALAAAGCPPLRLPAAPPEADVGATLREPAVVITMLTWMAWADTEDTEDTEDTANADDPAAEAPPAIVDWAGRRLRRLDRRLQRMARQFLTLDDEQRHWLRRRIKQLRYGVEATQTLWPGRDIKRYLAALRPMQEALGVYNDLQVAEAWLARTPDDPKADATGLWFARGWLAAQRQPLLAAAAKALQDWPKAPKAW